MGNTFPLSGGGVDAVEGVFGNGRAPAVRRSAAGRRSDERGLSRVRHFAQDRLQDFRALQRFVARINSRAQSASRSDIYVRRTYSGRPSSIMRFSEAAAMATSVVCRPPVRERSASPITRL